MSEMVKKYTVNTEGRDYVVGDIHGCFDLVLDAMRSIGFDKASDRLFCVGDLIDRGPGSERVLAFLAQPYVHSVRGNHEQMLLELHETLEQTPEKSTREVIFEFATARNGLRWWRDVPDSTKTEILSAISRLPYAIEIETRRGSVGLVHAEVPVGMDWGSFNSQLGLGDKETLKAAVWGRERVQSGTKSGVKGIGRVFVGHTPQWDGLKRLGNVYAVDTGAVFGHLGAKEGGKLTVADIACCTMVMDEWSPITQVDVRVNNTDCEHSFGDYAG